MSEPSPAEKPPVDWDRTDGTEPDWPPGKKPSVHVCEGCGKPRPVDTFAAVDIWVADQYVPLVRCDECRTPVRKSDKPFDDREVTAAK